MAKKDAAAAALPLTAPGDDVNDSGQALALSPGDALAAALDFDFVADGLGEVDSDDFRLPVIVFNVKGKDEQTGQMRRIDWFYNTQTGEQYETLHCAFIHLHKSNSFSLFDNALNKTITYCGSDDRVTGRMREKHPQLPQVQAGDVRPCDGCPDKAWRKNADGKNDRNCDDVKGVFAVMLDANNRPTTPFLIRFKRTSVNPWEVYLNRHHLGKRQLSNGKTGNVPLFVFDATIRLEISKNGNFATPVITNGTLLAKDVIQSLAEQAKFFADMGAEASAAAEKQESRHESGAGAASGGNVSGDDFVDTTAGA